MRDKKRIPKILKELEKIWMKWPDLRLGQLLLNLRLGDTAMYYMEDEDLVKQVESYYRHAEKER